MCPPLLLPDRLTQIVSDHEVVFLAQVVSRDSAELLHAAVARVMHHRLHWVQRQEAPDHVKGRHPAASTARGRTASVRWSRNILVKVRYGSYSGLAGAGTWSELSTMTMLATPQYAWFSWVRKLTLSGKYASSASLSRRSRSPGSDRKSIRFSGTGRSFRLGVSRQQAQRSDESLEIAADHGGFPFVAADGLRRSMSHLAGCCRGYGGNCRHGPSGSTTANRFSDRV